MNESVTNYISDENTHKLLVVSVSDDYSIRQTQNMTDDNLINLCGGIPVKNISNFMFDAHSVNKDVCKAEIQCAQFTTVRTIDFEDSIIENDYMRVNEKRRGIRLNLFVNQVKEARMLGFTTLKVHAAGGSYLDKDWWSGYYFWAQTGYTMDDDYQERFLEWARINNRSEITLNELVKEQAGLDLCKEKGFDWWAVSICVIVAITWVFCRNICKEDYCIYISECVSNSLCSCESVFSLFASTKATWSG